MPHMSIYHLLIQAPNNRDVEIAFEEVPDKRSINNFLEELKNRSKFPKFFMDVQEVLKNIRIPIVSGYRPYVKEIGDGYKITLKKIQLIRGEDTRVRVGIYTGRD